METTTSTMKERTTKADYSGILKGVGSVNRRCHNENLTAIPSRIQARLDATQTAKLLGFTVNDIPILVQHGLLKPLGNPAPNAIKYFATYVIEELGMNGQWLNDATQVIYDYWKGKNDKKAR